MPPPGSRRFEFTDFSGGWVPSRHASRMQDNELRDLKNYVVGPRGQLITRPPLRMTGSQVNPSQIMALGVHHGEATDGAPWGCMIVDDGTGFTYKGFDDTTNLINLTDRDANSSQTPKGPARIIRYKGIYYALFWSDFNTRAVERIDPNDDDDFQIAGIQQPDFGGSGPTVAASAGGTLADATYQCAYTFYNPRTGIESVLSPITTVTTASPNSQISWSNINVAVDTPSTGYAQVRYRRLYRTLPDQTAEFYLVTTLADNTTTTYTDSVEPQNLGARILTSRSRFGNPNLSRLPEYGGFCMWRERLWMPITEVNPFGGGTLVTEYLTYSPPGLVETFELDALIPVGANESTPLMTCEGLDDRLIVFKGGSVWRLTGTSPSNFDMVQMTAPTGTPTPYANAKGAGKVFFFGSDGYVYFTDGVQVFNISERLGRLDLIDSSDFSGTATEVHGVVWASRNTFLLSKYNPTDRTSIVYAYDYVKDAWSYWTTGATESDTVPTPRCWALGHDVTNFSNRLYVGAQRSSDAWVMTFEDDLYNFTENITDQAPDDEGDPVDVSPPRSIRTKDFSLFGAGEAFFVRQVYVKVEWDVSITSATVPDANYPLNLSFTLYADTNTDVVVPSILAGPVSVAWSTQDNMNGQWFAIGLSSQQWSTTSVGLGIASTAGEAPRRHAITGIAFDAVPLNRALAQPGVQFTANVTP